LEVRVVIVDNLPLFHGEFLLFVSDCHGRATEKPFSVVPVALHGSFGVTIQDY
jgi:hypothetical protein